MRFVLYLSFTSPQSPAATSSLHVLQGSPGGDSSAYRDSHQSWPRAVNGNFSVTFTSMSSHQVPPNSLDREFLEILTWPEAADFFGSGTFLLLIFTSSHFPLYSLSLSIREKRKVYTWDIYHKFYKYIKLIWLTMGNYHFNDSKQLLVANPNFFQISLSFTVFIHQILSICQALWGKMTINRPPSSSL